MINYYLFSFDKIDGSISISKELGINISNVDEHDMDFLFHHLNGSLNILGDNYIKDKSQLNGLIRLSFVSKEYDDLSLKSTNNLKKRKSSLKEELDTNKKRILDEKLYLVGQGISNKLLEILDTQKNYLNTLLMCCGLNDFLIDLGNFTTYQKVKFDNDLNFHDTFKPLLEKGIEYSNAREYLKYLDFSIFKEYLIDVGSIIDNTIKSYENKEKFLNDINHIGGLLQVYSLSNTDKIRLTSLVSIIEYLLIRNPDAKQVCKNKEDGITKQFNYKVYKAINLMMKKNDLTNKINITEKDIKDIYNMRSNIVHGNNKKIRNLEKYLRITKFIVYGLLTERIKRPEYYVSFKNIKRIEDDNSTN